ncbi:hypothetical protein QBC41DRAFT_282984 [Cercophora samala]|uniref:Heterokaryon incompatibility domain-containing protein n=1 Tax=Cercophora samala TaxID=330535 RepID=A0AA39Z778_9PEZI|nr:hypothetical protein QBC41DRAFT_282984 [Cercophora samala]
MAHLINNNINIRACLREHGVPETTTRAIGQHELRSWNERKLRAIFRQIRATKSEIGNRSLRSFHDNYRGNKYENDLVKPAWNLIEESGRTRGALCVNRHGEFNFRPPGGYAALTHVWREGLQPNIGENGLHRTLLDSLFTRLAPLGVKWLWIDSLSIPGGQGKLSDEESLIKNNLINAMAGIYREAKNVIVIDALALRLESIDPVDVAVTLMCGAWITRYWTYQEIMFAADAIVLTAHGSVHFSEIVAALTIKASLYPDRYQLLEYTFRSLQRDDSRIVRLSDIVVGCKNREASVELDYARALFAILGLTWKGSYTLDEGMSIIYRSRPEEAVDLVLYHGPPRAKHLGWAPSVLSGMKNNERPNPGQWTADGLVARWCSYKLRSFKWRGNHEILLSTENWTTPCMYRFTQNFRAYVSSEERNEAIEYFQDAVATGTAYILTTRPLQSRLHQPLRVGLVVKKLMGGYKDTAKGWVCLTIAIRSVSNMNLYSWENGNWLLFHENPTHPPEEPIDQDEYGHPSRGYGKSSEDIYPKFYGSPPASTMLPPESLELAIEDPQAGLCVLEPERWPTRLERAVRHGTHDLILPPEPHCYTPTQELLLGQELFDEAPPVVDETYAEQTVAQLACQDQGIYQPESLCEEVFHKEEYPETTRDRMRSGRRAKASSTPIHQEDARHLQHSESSESSLPHPGPGHERTRQRKVSERTNRSAEAILEKVPAQQWEEGTPQKSEVAHRATKSSSSETNVSEDKAAERGTSREVRKQNGSNEIHNEELSEDVHKEKGNKEMPIEKAEKGVRREKVTEERSKDRELKAKVPQEKASKENGSAAGSSPPKLKPDKPTIDNDPAHHIQLTYNLADESRNPMGTVAKKAVGKKQPETADGAQGTGDGLQPGAGFDELVDQRSGCPDVEVYSTKTDDEHDSDWDKVDMEELGSQDESDWQLI